MSQITNDNFISPFGIENNMGVHCYMNSVLQLFFTIKEFREFIIVNYQDFLNRITQIHNKPSDQVKDNYIFEALHEILNQQFYNSGAPVNTNLLRNILESRFNASNANFPIDVQNDATEFLNLFFKELHREFYCINNMFDFSNVNYDSISNQESFISEIFKLNCKYFYHHMKTNVQYELNEDDYMVQPFHFSDYGIPIKIVNNYKDTGSSNPELQQLINLSLGSQIIDTNDGGYIVKRKFEQLPKYILLFISRYDDYYKKFLRRINIPLTVNIHNYVYNVISIVCHNGPSLNSGHYINYSKRGKSWFLFNDFRYTKMNWEDIFNLVCESSINGREDQNTSSIILCELTEQFEELIYY